MLERFTRDARRVVEVAERERGGLGGPIESEHLLLGVLGADGPGGRALASLGVTLDGAQDAIERLFVADLATVGVSVERLPWRSKPGSWSGERMAPRAKKVLEQALREALARKDNHIGTEHIMLALLRDPHSGAVRTLSALGLTPELVEAEVQSVAPPRGAAPRR